MVECVTEIDLEADPDDRVSLAAFAELWWADQRPPSVDAERFVDNKQAAIRMLRRNHPGFPAPVTASSRTHLFRLGDLAEWAVAAQKSSLPSEEAIQQRSATVGVEWHLDRAIDACAAELGPDRARQLALLIAMALDQSGVAPGLSKLPVRVRTLVDTGSDLSRLLRGIAVRRAGAPLDLAEAVNMLSEGLPASIDSTGRLAGAMTASLLAGYSAADVADRALDRCESQVSTLSQRRTGESLAMLMFAAGRPKPGEHLVDLAAGEADLLISAAHHAGGPVALTGVEVDRVTWAIGRCRLYLHRLTADFRIGDSLTDLGALPTGDLVLLDPPVDKRRDYVRWLAAARIACSQGGRAIVSLPALTAQPGRREWTEVGIQTCDFLVKCPARLRTDRGAPLSIWGLKENPGHDLLLVDASRLGTSRVGLREIDQDEADALRDLLEGWQHQGRVHAAAPLTAGAFPRAAFSGLPIDTTRLEMSNRPMGTVLQDSSHWPSRLLLEDRSDVGDAMTDALTLAERLGEYLDGDLRPYTAEQHRRAIQGLTQRLRAQVQRRATQST
jgi:hypothetical protein